MTMATFANVVLMSANLFIFIMQLLYTVHQFSISILYNCYAFSMPISNMYRITY